MMSTCINTAFIHYVIPRWLLSRYFIISFWVVFAFCLRLINIGVLSYWTDELHTLFLNSYTLWDYFANPTLVDHPPFYFLLVKYWSWVSNAEGWVRSLSALFGALTVVPLYGIACKIGSHRFANFAILFFVFSPFHLEFSQEARHYTLLLLLCTMVAHATINWQQEHSTFNRYYYCLSSFLLLFTHTVGGLFLLVLNVCYVVLYVRNKVEFRRWLTLQLVLLIIAMPVLILLFRMYHFKQQTGFWQQVPDGWLFLDVLRQYAYTHLMSLNHLLSKLIFFQIPYIPIEQYAYIPFLVLFFSLVFYLFLGQHKQMGFMLGITFGYLLVLFLISFVSIPIFAARTGIIGLIFVPFLCAFPVLIKNSGWLKMVLCALSVLCLLITVLSFYTTMQQMKKEQWRELMQSVSQSVAKEDLIVHWTYITGLGVEHYANLYGIDNPVMGIPQSYEDAVFTPTISFPPESIVAQVRSIREHFPRIWVIQYRQDQSPFEDELIIQGYQELDRQMVISLDAILYIQY